MRTQRNLPKDAILCLPPNHDTGQYSAKRNFAERRIQGCCAKCSVSEGAAERCPPKYTRRSGIVVCLGGGGGANASRRSVQGLVNATNTYFEL